MRPSIVLANVSRIPFIAAFRAPNVGLRNLLRRFLRRVPFIDETFGLIRPGTIIEVSGPSGSGRTQALLHAALTCVLPRTAGGLEGKDRIGSYTSHRAPHLLILAHFYQQVAQ